MVESSVKSISRPVIDRLPVNQLDEFACRQLDRVSRSFYHPRALEVQAKYFKQVKTVFLCFSHNLLFSLTQTSV